MRLSWNALKSQLFLSIQIAMKLSLPFTSQTPVKGKPFTSDEGMYLLYSKGSRGINIINSSYD